MKKRLISLLLVICMVLTLLPAEVLAAEVKKPADNATQTAVVQENPFTDVEQNSWYAAAVQYARVNGFFSGVSDTLFAPDGSMNRGMFVTVLGRMAGVDAAKYGGETGFSDVEPTAWYAPYVKWAAQYGIANGMGNGLFAPNDKINREQMAVFFAAYFEKFDVTPETEKATAGKPADLGQVSDWAKSAVLKLWSMGLLCGDGVNFAPKDTATRAEAATLCKSVDKSVETWYSEPGVESTRVSVDPEQQEPKPTPTPTPSGTSVTSTNYLVQFEMGDGQPTMTLPSKGEYASGTPITQLPTPVAQGMIFLGWFYDKELTRGVEIGDTVTKSMTLYAKAAAGSEVTSVETPNYVTKDEVPAGKFSFDVIDVNEISDKTIKFINITETNSPVTYTVNGTTVTAELKAGQTYQVELLDENARLKVDGAEQPASVRYLNIRTQKGETLRAGLNSDVKEIPAAQTGNLADDVFKGIYQIDPNGTTTRNITSGTFTYSGEKPLKVGDVLAVTANGASLNDVKSETGDVAYIKVTGVNGNKISYEMAEVEDVLFMPDVLPIQSGWDKDKVENQITISDANITTAMNNVSASSLDEGDFLAFINGAYSENSTVSSYGKITGFTVNGDGDYVITYTGATESDIENSLDVYYTEDRKIELSESKQKQIENEIKQDVKNSGYAEQAAVYLAALMMESDDLTTVPDADAVARRMEEGNLLTDENSVTLLGTDSKVYVEFDPKGINVMLKLNGELDHLKGNGFAVGVEVPFKVTIPGPKGNVEISIKANFTEEIILRQNISTSRHKIGFLRYDYSLNAAFMVGNYTGIKFNADITSAGNDEDKSMTEKLDAIMDRIENYQGMGGSSTDGTMDSLAEIYQEVMENANDTWIDIVDVKLFENNGSAFLHIFCWQIKGSFVVSANLAVSIGMNFEYATQKLYNFSVRVKAKTSTNQTIDIITPHYNFDFYVVGTIGIRAGLRLEMYVGLFSLSLDKIGITADVGAYAQLWGYFFYHLSWTEGEGKDSKSAGALYIEIGMYLEIHFVAQAFSSSKLTWNPTLYDNQWPLWSAGSLENVYDFDYAGNDKMLDRKVWSSRRIPLPSALFKMKYMEMKSGNLAEKNYDDDTESHYIISISNSKFQYDPKYNVVTVDPGTSVEETCDVTIIWKDQPLAFTSTPISRTVHISWSDPANTRTIGFITNGGSEVAEISGGPGSAITKPADPTKTGYDFGGWYTDTNCKTAFDFSKYPQMPETWSGKQKNLTLYAKWNPRNDTRYTVEHYTQNLTGNNYTLVDTQTRTGTTDGKTAAAAQNLTGFTPKTIQQVNIAADGSTVVKIYYTRNSYTISFTYGKQASSENVPITYKAKYESTIYAPIMSLEGYDFVQFEGFQSEGDNGGMKVTAGDMTFAAQWKPGTGITYRVEHYTQNTAGTGYTLSGEDPVESRTGATGERVTAASLSRERTGLTFDHATVDGKTVTDFPIAANGRTVVKLYYNRNDVTLTFDSQGGSAVSPITKKFGQSITMPANPTKTGYTFAGWYTNAECTDDAKFTASAMPGENLTLYAKWTVNKYTVTYVVDDQQTTEQVEFGTEVTLPAPPAEKAGYTFNRWEVSGAVMTDSKFTMPANNVTITAKWTANRYTITFDTDGGSAVAAMTQDYDTPVTAPAAPTKTGYTFAGWKPALPAKMPLNGLQVTAKWTVNQYTITFNTDGGSTVAAMTQDYGTAVTAPENPTKTGYTFAGWDKTIPETMPANHMTIKAKWTANTYSITYELDGGTMASKPATHTYGTATTILNPTKVGYDFAGWQIGGTDKGKKLTLGATDYTADITLTATWKAGTATQYTVNHYQQNANDDKYTLKDTETLKGTTGGQTAATAKTYTGFEPANSFAQAEIKADGSTVVNLYYDRQTFTVTFDAGGGTLNDDESKTFKYGQRFAAQTPTRTDYAFEGWYLADGTKFTDTTVTENMSLTAYWTAGEVNYTVVHYEMNTDGTYPDTPTSTKTETGTAGTQTEIMWLKLAGYGKGFTTLIEENGVKKAVTGNYKVTITGGATIKLYYARQEVQLSYMDYGYKLPTDTTYTPAGTCYYGAELNLPTPTKKGYKFLGWYTDSECTKEFTSKTVPAVESLKLYPKWKEFNVTYNVKYILMDADKGDYSNSVLRWTEPKTKKLGEVCVTSSEYYDEVRVIASTLQSSDNQMYCDKMEATINGKTVILDAKNMEENEVAENMTEVRVYVGLKKYQVTWVWTDGNGEQKKIEEKRCYGAKLSVPEAVSGQFVKAGEKYRIVNADGSYRIVDGWHITNTETGALEYSPDKTSGYYGTRDKKLPAHGITITATRSEVYYIINFYVDGTLYQTVERRSGQGDEKYKGKIMLQKTQYESADVEVPTKEHYEYAGWKMRSTGEVNVAVMYVQNNKNEDLEVVWEPTNYTYALDTNGGTLTGATTGNYTFEDEVTLGVPTKAGYNFAGWYTDENFTGDPVTKIPVRSFGEKTFYAKWTPATYTITFVDGEKTETQSLSSEGSLTLPQPLAQREHYTFSHWSRSGQDVQDVKYQPGELITVKEDTTFTAVWTPIAYNITYDLGGHGTNSDNPNTYTIESETFALAAPTPNTGYTFVGWYDAAEGGNQITSIQKGSHGDVTVYARWSTSGFNIIYADVNTANATNFDALPKSFTIDAAVPLVDAKMSKDSNLVFLYWCTNPDKPEQTKITEIAQGTNASVTLYAHCITTQILDLEDLTALRDAVNAGYSMAGETFHLVDAINLPSDWKSIGRNYTDTTGTAFEGTFDGGSTDPNVAITYPACGNNVMETVQPLFGVNAGTVQNLVVKLQATVNNWDADMPFGMVAQANATGGKITNCKVIAAADVTEVAVSKREYAGSAAAGPIGGIVGVNEGTITNCSVGNTEAAIRIKGNGSTDQSIGGIAAVNNGTISLANSCTNVIPEQSATYAGGLVGKNTGSVVLGANVELMGTGNGAWTAPFTYYGGLVGLSTGNITLNEIPTMSVDEKIATTKTETEYFAGGLVGKLEGCSLTVNSDAQAKEILVELYQDSYNPQKNTLYSGGLVGQAVNATVDGGGKLTIKGVTDINRINIGSQTYAGALAGQSDTASTFKKITLVDVRVKCDTTKGESYLFGSGAGKSENITIGANCKWNDKAVNGT